MPRLAATPASTRYEILEAEEVRTLVRRFQRDGDPRAADRLMRSHYRLVAKIARKHLWSHQELGDLIQAGCVGFLRALVRFDPRRGVLLSTYATHWIRAFIVRHILDNWRLVRVGTTQRQRRLFHRARRDEESLDPAETALHRHLVVPELSLDEPLRGGNDGSPVETHMSFLRAPEQSRPDVQLETEDARARVRAAVNVFAASLSGRDRVIFDERWRKPEPPTLARLGARMGISRERARQLERRLLERLEAYLETQVGDLREVSLAA